MASSSSSQNSCSYDAFISHRGPDVKQTLAFALYESLEEKGFWTFLDDQKLQLGNRIWPVIVNAIYSSTVQIAIFSPHYADSTWCLNELVLMLKTNALFIPVFCDVEPSDLRRPHKGVYKRAFRKHKKRNVSDATLKDWKEALKTSANRSGYEFKSESGIVEIFCSKIALAVQEKVGNTYKGFPRYVEDATLPEASTAPANKNSLLPRDSHPVGIDSKVEEIKALLEKPEVQVIAVVGMGGLGKTFLLQNVCKDLKSRYDYYSWLSVSKYYSVKDLQKDIASDIDLEKKIKNVSDEKGAEIIHRHLQGKRCLIVLDDLWTLSTEDNLLVKLGLTHKDCKVVVTTRDRKVAQNSKAHIYEMENLSDEDSWELFCFYAFPGRKENRAPSHLEEVGRQILKQCGNLPLAITTTAASLAGTPSLTSEWERKRDQLKKAIFPSGERNPVMDILRSSYDSLLPRLKDCFAYLSFFPEDAKIDPEYLVYLWIAEGCIPAGAGDEQWNAAWDWVDQLAQRCLLQLWEEENEENDLVKYCTVHDLLHDLAINISRENKCVFSAEEVYTHTNGATGWCRILLAKKDINGNALSRIRPAYLRTLSLSQNWIGSIPESLFTAVRGLRVLDLSWTGISTLPESVGKMVLLKVLNLRGTDIEELPDCVRHLKSLLFLAVPTLPDYLLPEWVTELTCLQFLECGSVRVKEISQLTALRTIRSQLESIEEDFTSMTQLQELQDLMVRNETEFRRIKEGIVGHLVKMRHLGIINWISEGNLWNGGKLTLQQLPENIREMKYLEKLSLCRFVMPSSICDMANLRELILDDCDCVDYPELQTMPNLVKLKMSSNDWCRQLPKAFGKSGAFPSLRFFSVDNFRNLEEFPELEEGAMPCLEKLDLPFCSKLKKVGGGLEQLKRLKEFTYSEYEGNGLLVETFKEGGEYCNKIKALKPHLTIHRY